MPASLNHGGHRPPLQDMEWEVLPPEDRHRRKSLEEIFRWVALIMDDFLRVPGTKFRFGLDPLIGLLPGIGDTASAITSGFVLFYAARSGVPKVLLARMAANILINEIIGIIPGLGDAFSFWFKSNKRNYEILKRYRAAPGRLRKSDWFFLILLLGLVLAIVCAGLFVSWMILQAMAKLVTS